MGAWMAARHGERCEVTRPGHVGDLHFVVTITVPDPPGTTIGSMRFTGRT